MNYEQLCLSFPLPIHPLGVYSCQSKHQRSTLDLFLTLQSFPQYYVCWSASTTKSISFSIPFSASICSKILLISFFAMLSVSTRKTFVTVALRVEHAHTTKTEKRHTAAAGKTAIYSIEHPAQYKLLFRSNEEHNSLYFNFRLCII